MRASALRTAIVNAIEAITPDTSARKDDVFRHAVNLKPAARRDRVFAVAILRPQEPALVQAGALYQTQDPYRITFQIGVYYNDAPNVTDRVLDDGDLIVDALRALPATNQIETVDIRGVDYGIADNGGQVALWDVEIEYDRRAVS